MIKKIAAAEGRKAPAESAPKVPEDAAFEDRRIRKSMLKWESMNAAGRLLGRGLERNDLISRVAREVGKTREEVRSALRQDG